MLCPCRESVEGNRVCPAVGLTVLGPTVLTRHILVPHSFLPHFRDLVSSILRKLEAPWSKACLAPRMHRVMQFPLLPFCTATLQARQGRAARAHRLPACLCCWLCLWAGCCGVQRPIPCVHPGTGHTVNCPPPNHCFGAFLCLFTYLASKQNSSWRLGRREKRKGNRTLRL